MNNRTWVVLHWFGNKAIELHRDRSWAAADLWAEKNGPPDGLVTIDDGEMWDRSGDRVLVGGVATATSSAAAG